ncbi:hypothetical protein [Sideroxydans lithotrophicus]|uniref:Sulfatase-modifying factor enzyme domain-containing protein n=1 Tax=Sideroxydans lithotrophicus (strain ES-1) TaxID=580332 RepID=D5CT89_SIDLE|nr:hypothetical protein [Sideroxydans lithotrophicus]ADE12175.1 hypothetical protein Slit_1946 [Sideroxydans lithotrophicus ES-1]
MNAPDQHQLGLYHKFNITRTDGKDAPGEKHHGDEHFVLNLTTDKNAILAIVAYADACEAEYPLLAADLRAKINQSVTSVNEFIQVPAIALPNGAVVPSFQMMKYIAGRGPADIPVSTSDAEPFINISYFDADAKAESAGYKQITALQSLAVSWDIYLQPENWLSGKVGVGSLKQGLHKGTVDCAQPGTYISPDAEEDRWFVLSNGERICDWSGNLFQWMRDDLHGDERGLTGVIPADSLLLTTCPAPSMKDGTGWRPEGGANWSGRALIRGGFWGSGSGAGVFVLYSDGPGYGDDVIGFRCTK